MDTRHPAPRPRPWPLTASCPDGHRLQPITHATYVAPTDDDGVFSAVVDARLACGHSSRIVVTLATYARLVEERAA